MPEPISWQTNSNSGLSPIEQVSSGDLEELSRFERRMFHLATHDVVESMLIGYLVGNRQLHGSVKNFVEDLSSADKIIESGIRGEWFDNKLKGKVFEEFKIHYRDNREKMTSEDARHKMLALQYSQDQASMFKDFIDDCFAATISRHIAVDKLIDRFKGRYFAKKGDALYEEYKAARINPKVGPETALEQYKKKVIVELSDPKGSVIKEGDWIADYKQDMGWMLDMKRNPKKYAGYRCGINAIDKHTLGFRPGQLTVFVGWHGGYKTTTLINVAFGLWENGYDVLYCSLEMEQTLMKSKFWCRGTKSVSFNRIFTGLITEPDDWKKLVDLEEQLSKLSGEEKKEAEKAIDRLRQGIAGNSAGPTKADTLQIEEYKKLVESRKNKLKVINIGQSAKMKISQLERYLDEKSAVWKPNVVIVDYLDLMSTDAHKDRWQELGDITKALRAMGEMYRFSAVTAAQFKRGAIERIRDHGLGNPEKAEFSTDDISGSDQIGADAENVLMLWKVDASTLMLFTPKSRHGVVDRDKGEKLIVLPDLCYVRDFDSHVQPMSEIADTISAKQMREEVLPKIGIGEFDPKNSDDGDDEDSQKLPPPNLDMLENPRPSPQIKSSDFDL